jgi:hypothetical protein
MPLAVLDAVPGFAVVAVGAVDEPVVFVPAVEAMAGPDPSGRTSPACVGRASLLAQASEAKSAKACGWTNVY